LLVGQSFDKMTSFLDGTCDFLVGEKKGESEEHAVHEHHQATHFLGHLPLEGHDGDKHNDEHEEEHAHVATHAISINFLFRTTFAGTPQQPRYRHCCWNGCTFRRDLQHLR